jgi:hypothetical protein
VELNYQVINKYMSDELIIDEVLAEELESEEEKMDEELAEDILNSDEPVGEKTGEGAEDCETCHA